MRVLLYLFLVISFFLSNSSEAETRTPPAPVMGTVTTRVGSIRDNAYAVAVQPDGKVLAVGASDNGSTTDMVVIRYLPDGSIDYSFGDGGAAVYGSELGDSKAYAVGIDGNARILVGGAAHNGRDTDFVVLRFLANGKIDKTFGRDGVARKDFGRGNDIIYSLAVQPDGSLFAGGSTYNGHDFDFAIWKLDRSGHTDVTFGNLGSVTTGLGDGENRPGNEYGYSLLTFPDGKIAMTGYSETDSGSVIATAKYTIYGVLDPSFGSGGVAVTPVGGNKDRAYVSMLQPDGKIVVAGTSASSEKQSRFLLARYNGNGTLDRSFGDQGVVLRSLGGDTNIIYSAAMDTIGRISTAGSIQYAGKTSCVLARFLPDGRIDPTFGDEGRVNLSLDPKYNAMYSIALQDDGKLVSGGVSSLGIAYQFAVTRFLTDGRLDPNFGGFKRPQSLARSKGSVPFTAQVGIPSFVFPGGP